jgi:sulfur relay (sulfurtransferase) DsrC/TusE family protein
MSIVVTLPRAVEINREMVAKRKDKTYEECLEVGMTPAQKEVFLVVDEWWRQYGFGPSIRDICEIRKKGGMGNTSEIINRLVKLGVLKKVKGSGRSVRPVYIQFRNLE